MDINDIMTDGKIDLHKLHSWLDRKHGFALEYIAELVDAINAHIAGKKQSTPITPELLERAGFRNVSDRFNAGRFESKDCFNFYLGSGKLCLTDNISFLVKTMEELSFIIESHIGRPLNWQHDPAAEVRKRLEAMGFEKVSQTDYHLFFGKGRVTFLVVVEKGMFSECYVCGDSSLIKSLDQLERVIKELKGE